jgi:hypothetical protein
MLLAVRLATWTGWVRRLPNWAFLFSLLTITSSPEPLVTQLQSLVDKLESEHQRCSTNRQPRPVGMTVGQACTQLCGHRSAQACHKRSSRREDSQPWRRRRGHQLVILVTALLQGCSPLWPSYLT